MNTFGLGLLFICLASDERLLFWEMEAVHRPRQGELVESRKLLAQRGWSTHVPPTRMLQVKLINYTTELKCIQCWRWIINAARWFRGLSFALPECGWCCLHGFLGSGNLEPAVGSSRSWSHVSAPCHLHPPILKCMEMDSLSFSKGRWTNERKWTRKHLKLSQWWSCGVFTVGEKAAFFPVWMYKLNLITFWRIYESCLIISFRHFWGKNHILKLQRSPK